MIKISYKDKNRLRQLTTKSEVAAILFIKDLYKHKYITDIKVERY